MTARTGYKQILVFTALLFICAGLGAAIFFQARTLAPHCVDNRMAFLSFASGPEQYRSLRPEWRTRLFSNVLAAAAARLADRMPSVPNRAGPPSDSLANTVALWTAGWLVLTNLLFLARWRERSLLFMLGTYAAVSFGYMPGIVARIYPWDMPALFAFCVFIALMDCKRPWTIVILVPLATAFKETAVLLAFFFLFMDMPWKKRIVLFVAATAGAVLVKGAIDLWTGSPLPLLTATHGDETKAVSRFVENMRALAHVHPVLVNAGMLAAFLLVPAKDRRVTGLKTIAGLFVAGNFVFARIQEYRIWFEMIPLALYSLNLSLLPGPRKKEDSDRINPQVRRTNGSEDGINRMG